MSRTTIDHFGNRRLRTVGGIDPEPGSASACPAWSASSAERMTTQDVEANHAADPDQHPPRGGCESRSFFGTSQLSQFMDQTNPLAGSDPPVAACRRSARVVCRVERAGFEVS